jgi:hypothetical protein
VDEEGGDPCDRYLNVRKCLSRGGKLPVANEVVIDMANKEVYSNE